MTNNNEILYLHKQTFLLEGLVFHPKYSWDNGDFPIFLRVFFMIHFRYLNKFHAELSSDLFINCYAVSCNQNILTYLILSLHLHQHDNSKYSFLNKSLKKKWIISYSAYPALNGSWSLGVTMGRLAKSCDTFSFSSLRWRNSGRLYSNFEGFEFSSFVSADKNLSMVVSRWDLSRLSIVSSNEGYPRQAYNCAKKKKKINKGF